MDTKTLIQLLNFSKTLIRNGELKFTLYENFPTHPDDFGATQQKLVASWEKQLQENPPKSQNPEALRKELLSRLEQEKKYGHFRNEKFYFLEINLVFQEFPLAYRMEVISRFENYPSFKSFRFFNDGGLLYYFSNGTKNLKGSPPNQLAVDRRIGYLQRLKEDYIDTTVLNTRYLPPSLSIDEMHAEVRLLETDTSTPTYVITHYPIEKVKVMVHVCLKNKLPEVFKEEFYYQSESPHADAEEYWLRKVNLYRDFEQVEALSITFPKVREVREFRNTDRFMRHHSILIIKEMDFNLGLPANFFDWDESELTNDKGRRKRIRGDVKKEESPKTQKEVTK